MPGREYILFLYWHEQDQAFRPYFGAEMMIEVRGGLNTRLGASAAASKLSLPASTSELEAELRAIAARGLKK